MLKRYVEIGKNADNLLPVMPATIGIDQNQKPQQRPKGIVVHQFLWISKGECEVEIPGEKRILKEGQCFFSRKNTPHSYQSTNGKLTTNWLTFTGGEDILKMYNVGDYLFFDMPEYATQSARQLLEFCASTRFVALRSAHTNLWINEIFCALKNEKQTLAEQIYALLERDFDKNFALSSIAERLHYNKYSLCHAYLKETGESIMQTLKKIRIRKAKHMLKYSNNSIKEIGKYSGFDSSSYFIKIFKELTGKTPGEYRDNA